MNGHINPNELLGTSCVAYSKQTLVGTSNQYVFIDNSTKKDDTFVEFQFRVQFQNASVPSAPGLDPLHSLYAEFAEEDRAMAEEGLLEYAQGLTAIDNE